MTADIVIRGGTVVDGTGAPGRAADVAVTDGVITEIGAGPRRRRGCSRPSGHDRHARASSTSTPTTTRRSSGTRRSRRRAGTASPRSSPATAASRSRPCRPEHRELLVRTLQHVEDMTPDTLFAGVPWDEFETFPQYLDAVERRGTAAQLRLLRRAHRGALYVMGEAGYERAATDDEIAQHAARRSPRRWRRARPGSRPASSPTHNGDRGRPVPSRVADLAELRALLEPLRDAGKGVVALLPGEKVTHADVFDLQRATGRPLTWTALLTVKGYPWHEKIMAANTAARAEGVEVWPQVSCRPLMFQMNLREPFTFNMRAGVPGADGPARRGAPRRVPRSRRGGRRRWEELQGKRGALPVNCDALAVAESPTHPELDRPQGRRPRGGARRHAARRRCSTSRSRRTSRPGSRACSRTTIPRRSRGCSRRTRSCSAWPTPARTSASSATRASRPTCSATGCATRRSCRSSTRSTSSPASRPAVFGLHDRGTIEVGKAADVVVFDFDTVAPGPLRRIRDFPADGERLVADEPEGMQPRRRQRHRDPRRRHPGRRPRSRRDRASSCARRNRRSTGESMACRRDSRGAAARTDPPSRRAIGPAASIAVCSTTPCATARSSPAIGSGCTQSGRNLRVCSSAMLLRQDGADLGEHPARRGRCNSGCRRLWIRTSR